MRSTWYNWSYIMDDFLEDLSPDFKFTHYTFGTEDSIVSVNLKLENFSTKTPPLVIERSQMTPELIKYLTKTFEVDRLIMHRVYKRGTPYDDVVVNHFKRIFVDCNHRRNLYGGVPYIFW